AAAPAEARLAMRARDEEAGRAACEVRGRPDVLHDVVRHLALRRRQGRRALGWRGALAAAPEVRPKTSAPTIGRAHARRLKAGASLNRGAPASTFLGSRSTVRAVSRLRRSRSS